MDHLVNEMMQMGLLGAQKRGDEISQVLAVIQRFAEAVSLDQGTTTACRHFVQIIIEESGFENCSILFWNQHTSKLALVAAYGLDDQLEAASRRYRQNLRFGSGQNVSGQVFSSGKPVFIENTAEHPIPELKDAVVTPVSLACIPILHLGVLNLSSYHPQKFTPQLRRNWETIGNIIGHLIVGLQRAREAGQHVVADQPASEAVVTVMQNFRTSQISDLVLDFMPQGICILDTEGRIVRINRSLQKIQGKNFPKSQADRPLCFSRIRRISKSSSREHRNLMQGRWKKQM